MHPLYNKYNSRRALNWRFERVMTLLEARPVLPADPRVDDEYICIARRFLGKFLTSTPREQSQLFPDNPGLYYAYELFNDPDQDRAHFIQTCLLSGMDDEQAAERCAEMPATIDWYEAMFYNVRDRLDAKLWITKNCLGPAAERFIDDHGRVYTAKLFSYFCGPLMVDMMLTGFDPNKDWAHMESFEQLLDLQAADSVRRRSASSLMTVEINRFNVMDLVNGHLKLMELAQVAKTNDEARTIIEDNVESMLSKLPWRVGGQPQSALGPAARRQYQTMNAELRADEMLISGVGKDVVLPEEVRTLRIPEPRVADENAQQGS